MHVNVRLRACAVCVRACTCMCVCIDNTNLLNHFEASGIQRTDLRPHVRRARIEALVGGRADLLLPFLLWENIQFMF